MSSSASCLPSCPSSEALILLPLLHPSSSVLVPFHPTFAQVWGWTVAAAVVGGCALLSLLTLGGWWLWQKRRSRHGTDYEPVEEEED